MLEKPLHLGDTLFHPIIDGMESLDGGAMFGVVPRVLWEKKIAPDGLNRIPLACRCLYFKLGNRRILIDTGIGMDYSPKFREMYALPEKSLLVDSLAFLGVHPEGITDILQTHLHFDHAGSITTRFGPGEEDFRPTFPNAQIFVHAANYREATDPEARNRASYLTRQVAPICDRLTLIEENSCRLFPGVTMERTDGHCQGHAIFKLEFGGQHAVYAGDIIPTVHHLPLNWIMAYDLDPMTTYRVKRELSRWILDHSATVIFEHDPKVPYTAVTVNQKGHLEPRFGGG